MKKKVTIKVRMENDSCRNKALEIASIIKGVSSVSIHGNDKDQLVVTGEDVDTVCLGKLLRKKFCGVKILTVEEVKPKPPEKKDDKKKARPCIISIVPLNPCFRCQSSNCHGHCKPCLRCESPQCHGNCKPCSRCESYKCHGDCKPCIRCEGPKCHGDCKPCFRCEIFKCHGDCKACLRCGRYKCRGECTSSLCVRLPCHGRCPPWISCSSCCIKTPPPCDNEIYIYIYLFVIIGIVISVYAKHSK